MLYGAIKAIIINLGLFISIYFLKSQKERLVSVISKEKKLSRSLANIIINHQHKLFFRYSHSSLVVGHTAGSRHPKKQIKISTSFLAILLCTRTSKCIFKVYKIN